MKQRRVHLERRAVPPGYEPAYPAELSPEQYRTLILASTQLRARRLALAAGALACCSASAQESAPASREEQVLALVRELHAGGLVSWYTNTSFRREGAAVVPDIPISFGNSHNGVFDAGRARELGRRLFEIYGLSPSADVRFDIGDGAVLDAFDAARNIGFELSGRKPSSNRMFATPEAEPPDEALDEAERLELAHQGIRVLAADLARYPLMDGDQFTPMLAWLAGLAAFLNELTDGPELDLSALLFARAQRFPLPDGAGLALPLGVSARAGRGHLGFLVERPATLRLEFGGDGAPPPLAGRKLRHVQATAEPLDRPLSTAGAPTVLHLVEIYDALGHERARGESPLRLRLLQADLEVESEDATLFAPSAFDAARPFALELRLAPGSHQFWNDYLLVGVPAER